MKKTKCKKGVPVTLACMFACFMALPAPGDPPKKRAKTARFKPASTPASKPKTDPVWFVDAEFGPIYWTDKGMNRNQRDDMKSDRYHVFRLKQEVQKAFSCERCHGKGKVSRMVPMPGRNQFRMSEPRDFDCDDCNGTKVCPQAGCQTKVSDYCVRLATFELRYPFKAPLDTGLEQWLSSAIKNEKAGWLLNQDAARYISGSVRKGQAVVIMVIPFHNTFDADKRVVQATMHVGPRDSVGVNLWLYFPSDAPAMSSRQVLLLIGFNEGVKRYEALLGEREALALTVVNWAVLQRV